MLNVIRSTRQTAAPGQPASSSPAVLADTLPGFGVGSSVTHPKFGEGVIMNVEGQGEYARVQVNFSSAGSKWLVAAYANLSAV